MKVLVDTPVLSLVLRRQLRHLNPDEAKLRTLFGELVTDGRVLIIGPVRQELLSGLREITEFERLRDLLRPFPDTHLQAEDFESAAQMSIECTDRGIANSSIDMLICSVAHKMNCLIFTTDQDFARYAKCLPIRVLQPQTP